jgi:hypothetical protein
MTFLRKAKSEGVQVHNGWICGAQTDGYVRVGFWLPYLVPDAAWAAVKCVNSPVDDDVYSGNTRVLRDRYYGTIPVNLVFSVIDILASPPGDRDKLPTYQDGITCLRLTRFLESLPISVGYSSVIGCDSRVFDPSDVYDGHTSVARLLKADTRFEPYAPEQGEVLDHTVLTYEWNVFNLTCAQRIFSVQACSVVMPSYDGWVRPSPSLPSAPKKQRTGGAK